MAGELATYLDPTGLSRALWAVPRSFDLFQQLSGQSVTDENRPAGTRSTLNKAPVIWDAENKRWIADRPEGYGAPIGGKPHIWNTERQEWVPMPGAQIPEQKTEDKPSTGAPPSFDERGGSSTGVDTQAGTQGTQPTPQETFDQLDTLREWFPEVLAQAHQQELQRSLLTATLRDRGLRELSRRNIEQENIKAWAAVRTAQEQARSNQAIALANTAYLAQTPNVALGQMLNDSMKSAMTPVQLYAPRG
jgi:hypothetical protein